MSDLNKRHNFVVGGWNFYVKKIVNDLSDFLNTSVSN